MKIDGISRTVIAMAGLAACLTAAGCGNPVEGTYGDANGPTKIELKSGGKAIFTFMNQAQDCTYTVDVKKVSLDCKEGEPLALTISDDGTTLIMPPGSLMPNMKKSK